MINENIISKIDDHFVFDFVGLDELTEQEKHQLHTEQLATYATLNEIRREQDKPDLEFGDIPMNPTYLQYMQVKMQQEQQQKADEQVQQAQASAGGGGPSVEGGEGGDDRGTPSYGDRFKKSLGDRGTRFIEIELELDQWKAGQ